MKISQIQADFQNKVELYLLVGIHAYQDINGDIIKKIPAIVIKNVGNSVIYLEKYVFNGREYPKGRSIIPPTSSVNDACYTIELPTDGTPHVSLQISFQDWQGQKWDVTGYADLKEGFWELTYSPCVKIDKT